MAPGARGDLPFSESIDSNEIKSRIKRARPQLSCVPCRNGKLKCDRATPFCDQCIKRSREDACIFLPPPPKVKAAQNMKGRIRHLENLVVDLMNKKQSEEGEVAPTRNTGSISSTSVNGSSPGVEEPQKSTLSAIGKLHISGEGGETSYVNGSHWSAIMDEIQEVKSFFEQENEPPEDEPFEEEARTYHTSQVTFGIPRLCSRQELLDLLPSKAEVDNLVIQWFNSHDPFLFALHVPTFQKEYNRFWTNPNEAPVMWIGLLYAIMSVSICLTHRGEIFERAAPTPANQRAAHFQSIASCAMALADIGRGHPYTLECLLLYSKSDVLRSDETRLNTWLLMGVIVRIALKMGYHREPGNYSNISPFKAEMRRRIWLLIFQMDIMVSFAIGLPSLVRTVYSDAKMPSNLLDKDFSPDCYELPASRPPDRLTPAAYAVAKGKLSKVFAVANESAHVIEPLPWSATLELEADMDAAIEELPPQLHLADLQIRSTDRPGVLMCRYNLRLIYLKSRIVLHRRFLTKSVAGSSSQAAHSRTICVDASLEILRHQRTLWKACQLGGKLWDVRWYLTALTAFDFLLASMIICLELNRWCNTSYDPDRPVQDQVAARNVICKEVMQALELFNMMLNRPGYRNVNAQRASNFLRFMLQRVQEADPALEIPQLPGDGQTELQLAPTPDMLGDIEIPTSAQPVFENGNPQDWLSMNTMLDPQPEIDWTAFDEQMKAQDVTSNDPSWLSNVDVNDILAASSYTGDENGAWVPWSRLV